MKRLIKFKGKRTDTGEWVFGDLKHRGDMPKSISPVQIGGCSVIPETVGQYWRTVNNQELYEGDIFTVNGKYPKVVRWIEKN